jgi:NAD(P)-dependent dehydrogenase (short-subunit alcohol dehydrogenase family)
MAIYPDLKDKTVLVTGGGSGIGASIVEHFAKQGSKVGFIDIAVEPSRKLAADLTAQGHCVRFENADLTDTEALRGAVEAVRQAFGPITVLVNNAAHDDRHPTETVTPEYFDNRMAVNFKHQFFATQAVLPDMKAAGGGAVINFSSVSWVAGMGGMPVYTAAKSAVVGFTRAIARDYGPFNIRCNAIAPGWILTERQLEKWYTPEGEKMLFERQALKRKLYPPDIARVVLFMASEDASAISGQHYVVDGGWT